MQKPIALVRQEFIENLVKLINESGLPLMVIQPILKDMLEDVSRGMQREYEQAKASYTKALEEETKSAEETV